MSESARLAALKQLCAHMTAETNVPMFRGRYWFGKDDPLPMLSILEAPNPDQNPDSAGWYSNTQKENWTLLLQGWVEDDKANPTDPAHALMATAKAALGKLKKQLTDQLLPGTPLQFSVGQIGVEPGVVRPPDELSNKAYFWMRIVLEFVEDIDEPFWIV